MTCRGCGYDLRGLRDNRCPECGAVVFDAPVVTAEPPPPPPWTGASPGTCPGCLRPFPPGSPVCATCNFDARVGLTARVRIAGVTLGERRMTCRKCRYDLHGIRDMRCPECGTAVFDRRARFADDPVTAGTYVVPSLIFAGAFMLSSLVHGLAYGGQGLLEHLIGTVLSVGLGIGVFWFVCWIHLGYELPLRVNAARLLAIFGVTDLATSLFGLAGFSLPLEIVPAGMLMGALYHYIDMDMVDSILVGFVIHVARRAVILALVPAIL